MAYGGLGPRIASIAGAAVVASISTAALAAERDFSIPPQPLVSALKAFGDQSGQAILFRQSAELSASSPGGAGRMEPAVALTRLLEGSAFQYRRVGRGFVLVRAPRQRPSSPEVAPPPVPAARRTAVPPAAELPVSVPPVVITGTLVRGAPPAGSALIAVSRDTIRAVAPTNVKEVMATVPQLGNFGTNAEQSTPNRFRTQGFIPNLHNLGAYATLTLLNGHRVAATGTEGTFPDPSTVPPIAIQRVEIVADGASPIYGSDAVAGVVNFVYREPFDGFEASATYSFAPESRYEKHDLGLIGGRLWEGGGLLAAYEYSSNRSPLNIEVPALARGGDQRSRGGRDLRSTVCPAANVRNVSPNGALTGPTYGPAPSFATAASARACGVLAATTLIPDGERHALLITAHHTLTDRAKVWGELNVGRFSAHATVARPSISVIVPRSNPFFNAANIPPSLLTADRVLVTRSGVGLFSPTVVQPGSSSVLTAVAGLDLDFSADWKGAVSLVSSATRDYNQSTEFDANNIIAAVNDPDPATALNLFGQAADNNPATLARLDTGAGQRNWGQQRMHELKLKADGPVAELPGGVARAAVGGIVRFEQLHQLQTAGSPRPESGYFAVVRRDDLARSVAAAFAEFNVPLIGEDNRRPLVEALTLSLSGRYDYYDSYGGRFNPKYGLIYSPVDGLDLRASYGSNFAAPVLGLLTQPFGQPQYNVSFNQSIGYGPFAGTPMNNINTYIVSGGSPDLQPEVADTRSFGFDYTPVEGPLAGLRLAATWYHARYSNLVYKIPVGDIIINPAFAGRGIFFPSQAEIAAAIAQAPPASPITTTNYDYITRATLNLGTRIFEGLDLEAGWRLDTERSVWRFAVNANRQLRYDQEITPGSGFASRLGTQEAVRWKVRYTAAWDRGPWSVTAFANVIDSYLNTAVTPAQAVDRFVTVDVTAAYDIPSWRRGVTLQARVANLFDQAPPFFDSAAGYNAGLASPFGRTIDLTLRVAF